MISYKYLGSGTQYELQLDLYFECLPSTVGHDLMSSIGVYDSAGISVDFFNIPADTSTIVTVTDSCNGICIRKVSYIDTVSFSFQATGGYVFRYERCCFSTTLTNLQNSGSIGFGLITNFFYTGSNTPNNSSPTSNSSSGFIVQNNQAFSLDFSATDPDGDQLTYTFTSTPQYLSQFSPKPLNPSFNPNGCISLSGGYSNSMPIASSSSNPAILYPTTGIYSGTPVLNGLFIMTVLITETRNGSTIGTSTRTIPLAVSPCLVSSIGKNEVISKNKVFPNPILNRFKIQSQSKLERVYIQDFKGKILKELNLNNNEFELTDLPSGIYLLRLESKAGTETKKIIKQ